MIKYSYFNPSYLLAFVFLLLLSSCATRNKNALFQSPNEIDPALIKDVYVVNDQGQTDIYYKIKINDVIAVRNLQDRNFGITSNTSGGLIAATESGPTYPVDANGTVNLPNLGKILLAGLTRREATAKLQALYESPEQLKNPIIELTIVNVKVTMMGEFNQKGNFLLQRDNIWLTEMIGIAGGLSKDADPKTIRIIRGDRANPEIILVNLTSINSLGNRKLILQNNDIIIVEPTKNVLVTAKLQSMNNIIQPVLVVLNLAIFIFTLTR